MLHELHVVGWDGCTARHLPRWEALAVEGGEATEAAALGAEEAALAAAEAAAEGEAPDVAIGLAVPASRLREPPHRSGRAGFAPLLPGVGSTYGYESESGG